MASYSPTISGSRSGNYKVLYQTTISGQNLNAAITSASKILGFIVRLNSAYDIQLECNYFIPCDISKTAGAALSAMSINRAIFPHTSNNVVGDNASQPAFDGFIVPQFTLLTNGNIIFAFHIKPYTQVASSPRLFDIQPTITMLYEE